MKLIIDMDGLVYKAAFVTQKVIRVLTPKGSKDAIANFTSAKDRDFWCKGQGLKTRKAWQAEYDEEQQVEAQPESRSIEVFDSIVKELIYRWDADETVAYLGGKDNFRNSIYPGYKAGRPPKPANYYAVRAAAEKIATIMEPYEADDLVIIDALSTDGRWVISSPDKDLRQIAGIFYNPDKGMTETVTQLEADKNFYSQIITGDPVDKIPGMGRGAKAAAMRVKGCSSVKCMQAVVKDAWKGRLDEMNRNASLLYLLREFGDKWQPI